MKPDNESYKIQLTVIGLDKKGRERMVNIRADDMQEFLADSDAKTHLIESIVGGKVAYAKGGRGKERRPQAHSEQERDGAQWCEIHSAKMFVRRSGKASWYSHRLDDGTWCKGYEE